MATKIAETPILADEDAKSFLTKLFLCFPLKKKAKKEIFEKELEIQQMKQSYEFMQSITENAE